MTMTLEISSETEAVLRRKAELFGLDISEYLVSLAEADVDGEYALTPEDVEIIQQGLDEIAAGEKGISLEQFHAETMETFARLKQQKLEFAA